MRQRHDEEEHPLMTTVRWIIIASRIREAIEALRYDKVILNLDNGDGYYIPDSTPQGRQEAAVWLAKQDRRMRSMKYSTRGARRFVAHDKKRDMPGQINMFGAGGI